MKRGYPNCEPVGQRWGKLESAHMPDEELIVVLERKRGKGRDDYPIRAMWNSVLAGIVFQHESVEKLRRELARNGQLREMCGLDNQVPPSLTEGHALLERMQPDILKAAETLAADRGYDRIKPVIDIRNCWKDGEETHVLSGKENVAYDYEGHVYCFCPVTGTPREMVCGGFEKDRPYAEEALCRKRC